MEPGRTGQPEACNEHFRRPKLEKDTEVPHIAHQGLKEIPLNPKEVQEWAAGEFI